MIHYKNSFFNTDAYDSIVHSGLFTYFEGTTQDKLSNLYIRIKKHNEILKYKNEFEDRFFMNDARTRTRREEREKTWFRKVTRYEVTLTKYRGEIINLLDTVENSIREEIP